MASSEPFTTYRRVSERAGVDCQEIEDFASHLSKSVARGRRFHCLITGDAHLRRLNCQFLGRDYATDVLSFPSEDGNLGELAISCRRAAVQAKVHGHSVTKEIELLMLHGVLHLMGFDHERDSGEMMRAETKWRAKLGLPCGLIERTGRGQARKAV